MDSDIRVAAVGDIMVKRAEPESMFEHAAPVLRAADVTFGNCESAYSTRGSRNPAVMGEVCAHPDNIKGLSYAGFDVMSLGNNHFLDAGYDAMFDTIEGLRDCGIITCGAGANITEAREPAVIERNGTTVAFLGYSSILFPGFAAAQMKPGCAPITVHTVYQQVHIEQPGSDPRILTFPDPQDVAAMQQDVERAKERADIVVFTPHWGLCFLRGAVADYESVLARAAIDAGADVVLGHHQHIIKPIEIYRGRAIFHGMGNFAMDVDMEQHEWSPKLKAFRASYPEGVAVGPRDDYPTYPYHPDCRQTMIAQLDIVGRQIARVSFRPCYINPAGQPVPLVGGDERFDSLMTYVREITAEAGYATRIHASGDDLVVVTE
jgi:poly-gamma-glutamate capsule biosynthesis protein CapA/YwtB (metallophosphatase superfamily)